MTFHPGDREVRFEERVLFFTRRWKATVIGADIEMGEDIDGDPYGSLVLRLGGAEDLIAAEGNDIERLEQRLADVDSWLSEI